MTKLDIALALVQVGDLDGYKLLDELLRSALNGLRSPSRDKLTEAR